MSEPLTSKYCKSQHLFALFWVKVGGVNLAYLCGIMWLVRTEKQPNLIWSYLLYYLIFFSPHPCESLSFSHDAGKSCADPLSCGLQFVSEPWITITEMSSGNQRTERNCSRENSTQKAVSMKSNPEPPCWECTTMTPHGPVLFLKESFVLLDKCSLGCVSGLSPYMVTLESRSSFWPALQ